MSLLDCMNRNGTLILASRSRLERVSRSPKAHPVPDAKNSLCLILEVLPTVAIPVHCIQSATKLAASGPNESKGRHTGGMHPMPRIFLRVIIKFLVYHQ